MAAAASASSTLQSYLACSPLARPAFKSYSSVSLLPTVRLLPCKRAVRVRCEAAEEKQEQPAAAAKPIAPPETTQSPPPPPPKPKMSTKFSDVLAFSGPAPERINGRLAMIGFVAAMGAELASGNDLAAQLANGGFPWFVATAAVFSAASLIPLFKGVDAQSKSGGLMTADAEMWNGRFAMLGLVALAFTEYVKGGPLV